MIGDNETTGESEDCDWVESAVRDSGRGQTFGNEVEKQSTQFHFVSMTENVATKTLRTTG